MKYLIYLEEVNAYIGTIEETNAPLQRGEIIILPGVRKKVFLRIREVIHRVNPKEEGTNFFREIHGIELTVVKIDPEVLPPLG